MGFNTNKKKDINRECVVTKELLPKSSMYRFVLSPVGQIYFDVNNKLPGKGIWITKDITVLVKALKENLFKVKGRRYKLSGLNITTMIEAKRVYLLSLISLANKSGFVVLGQDRIAQHLDKGLICAVLMASDSAENSKKKLQQHISDNVKVIDSLLVSDISEIFPEMPVGFIGFKAGHIVDKLLSELADYSELQSGLILSQNYQIKRKKKPVDVEEEVASVDEVIEEAVEVVNN